MTHVAWVPPEWLEAAERTLEGLEDSHPSRTIALVPQPDDESGLDVTLTVRCASTGDRAVSSEVIWLRLRGDVAGAPRRSASARDLGPAGVPALPASRRSAPRTGSSSSESPTGWWSTRRNGTSCATPTSRRRSTAWPSRTSPGRAPSTGASSSRTTGLASASRRSASAGRGPRQGCCEGGSRRCSPDDPPHRARGRPRRAARRRGARCARRAGALVERPAQRGARPLRARPHLRGRGARRGLASLVPGRGTPGGVTLIRLAVTPLACDHGKSVGTSQGLLVLVDADLGQGSITRAWRLGRGGD